MTELLDSIESARNWRSQCAAKVAAVYTMGALHEGHVALLRRAAELADAVVVSIFVNPTQFNSTADLAAYPRTLERDLEICRAAGVSAVFAPTSAQMYPSGPTAVTLDPGPLGDLLEGASRPGHFRGVLTVVGKLTSILQPDFAVFGEKDYQQLSLIQRAAADLDWPTRIVGLPTVRDHDGLALSSRNTRLDKKGRALAGQVPAALALVRHALLEGQQPAAASALGRNYLDSHGIAVDYLEILNNRLEPPTNGPYRVLVAATVAGVRLIDNIEVEA